MSSLFSFDKSTAAQYEADIQSIAIPLYQHFKISYFGYLKIYEDTSHIGVSTNHSWLKCYYDNFFEHGVYQKTLNAFTSGFHLWSQLKDQLTVNIMRTDFQVAHGITLVKKNEDSCEIFSFATRPEHLGITTWYLNNLDLLEAFARSFKEKSESILQDVEQDRLIVPKCIYAKDNDIFHSLGDFNVDDSRTSFLEETKVQRFLLSDTPKKRYLSLGELKCISHIMKGNSIKNTAQVLNLSQRTAQMYLNNARRKLGAKNMVDLVVKIMQLGQFNI